MKYLILVIATLAAAIGESFLSYGMRNMGDMSAAFRERWPELILAVVRNIHVTVGVSFLAIFFFLYLATLSWFDLSFAMPLTSMSYVFAAILARFFLREEVSWKRWLGTVVILLGITLLAMDRKPQTGHGARSGLETSRAPETPVESRP
jgi:drug/metabolite transporter (DMT)-like permease